MIRPVKEGTYRLIALTDQTKLLILDNLYAFGWAQGKGIIGKIFMTSRAHHRAGRLVSTGSYRIYDVRGEPEMSDQLHIEMHTDRGTTEGYLLPAGIPAYAKRKKAIIPTTELMIHHEHTS